MLSKRDRTEGFVLIFALALLAIFSMFGVAWVRYLRLEMSEGEQERWQAAATHTARSGVDAAIAELSRRLRDGQSLDPLLSSTQKYEVPLYRTVAPTKTGYAADKRASGTASVTISDECAKINVNTVPPSVLSRLFGVSGEVAREIRRSLPTASPDAEDTSQLDAPNQWLINVDDLLTRGLLTPEQFSKIAEPLVTVYTAVPGSQPLEAQINLNTAPPQVLAAVFDIDEQKAQQAASTRPWTAVSDVATAAGKEPTDFNIRPEAGEQTGLPESLALSTRCFRVVSEGRVVQESTQRHVGGTKRIEAVVYINVDGSADIRFWSEAPAPERKGSTG